MSFRPLHDHVLVRPIEDDDRSAGGVIIPDTAREKPMRGTVLYVGRGARRGDGALVPPEVKGGDTVLFGKWAGTEVTIYGEDLVIMKESDILGVVEAAAANKP